MCLQILFFFKNLWLILTSLVDSFHLFTDNLFEKQKPEQSGDARQMDR